MRAEYMGAVGIYRAFWHVKLYNTKIYAKFESYVLCRNAVVRFQNEQATWPMLELTFAALLGLETWRTTSLLYVLNTHDYNLRNHTCCPSKATAQGACDLVTLTRDFNPASHTLLKIDSLRSLGPWFGIREPQWDVMRWNKLSMSTLSFLLCLPRTMMIAAYLSHCCSPLWACLPDFNKSQGGYANIWCAVGGLAELCRSLHCDCALEHRYITSLNCITRPLCTDNWASWG